MKKIISLILVLLLLCGCSQTGDPAPSSSAPAASDRPTAQPIDTDLFEDRLPVGSDNNLWYLPSSDIEAMTQPTMFLFGEDLLFYSPGSSDDNPAGVTLISAKTGKSRASYSFEGSMDVSIQIGEDCVIASDCHGGRIVILDGNLSETQTYSLSPMGNYWSVDLENDCVYIFTADGILSHSLSSGDESTVLDGVCELCVLNHNFTSVSISYTDADSSKCFAAFDTSEGIVRPLPIDQPINTFDKYGSLWLLSLGRSGYIIINDNEVKSAIGGKENLSIVHGGYLLGSSEGSLSLYDAQDGAFVSRCSFDGYYTGSMIYYGKENGYLFLTSDDSGHTRLMFWDGEIGVKGDDLSLTAQGVIDDDIYTAQQVENKIKQLYDTYGITVHTGSDCKLDYGSYTASPLDDPSLLSYALDMLERAISAYPEGFFKQLSFGSITDIFIDLVAQITLSDGTEGVESPSGFATEVEDGYLLVLDARFFDELLIYHEFSHVIDSKLAYDASTREGALFSEKKWLSLQPKGFDYAYDYAQYSDLPESVLKFLDSGYFLSDYSMTYPTEDRAETLSYAMYGYYVEYERNPKVYDKLEYYSRCIRDCFDTTGWPEVTSWEEMLNNR